MKEKVTAKDVAREAGVSVATVSYVLNDRKDQKISEDTKKKVLQIANLLNYIPSHAAKSLATGCNNAIGISYNPTDSLTRNSSVALFITMMVERLNRMKYDVTFIPSHKTEEGLPINRNIDAIIAIDLATQDFRALADNYLVPVICVDMLANDPLFYQIYEDIPFLIQKASMQLGLPEKIYFIYDSFNNAEYENFVLTLPDTVFPIKSREVNPAMIQSLNGQKVVVYGGYLGLTLYHHFDPNDICIILSEKEKVLIPGGLPVLINNDDKKANLTMNIVMNALKRNFEITHDNKLR